MCLLLALTVFAAICVIILFFCRHFEKILSFTIFLDCFGMVLSAATIFFFRKKTKHLDGTGIYKMKFYPIVAIDFYCHLYFCWNQHCMDYKNNDYAALTGLGVLVVFTVFILLFNKKQVNLNKQEPVNGSFLYIQ